MTDPAHNKNPQCPPDAVGKDDEPLSPAASAALQAGLESARRGEIKPWGDFTKYITTDDE